MRDFHDPATVSAELEGVSALVCALYVQFAEGDRPALTEDTIAEALFGLQCYLERISETVSEFQARKEAERSE